MPVSFRAYVRAYVCIDTFVVLSNRIHDRKKKEKEEEK